MSTRVRTGSRSRRRRIAAATTIAIATAVAGVAVESGGASAAAPHIKVKVRHRTLFVRGTNGADLITLRVPAATPQFLAVDFGDDGSNDVRIHRDRFDKIVVRARRGDDVVRIDETAGTLPFSDTTRTILRGQPGRDTLLGGSGAEKFYGGPGHDTVDGNQGNDFANLGGGNDEFIWDPGDGSDTIEGRRGHDLMTFNGSGGDEIFDASANGARLRFFRNLGNIVMDTDDVEQVDLNALGGADDITVNDLSATDVVELNVDGAGADGALDVVHVQGTGQPDTITVSGDNGAALVEGLVPTVALANFELTDLLEIASRSGGDHIDASALGATTPTIDFKVLAGSGHDRVFGGRGADDVFAGSGHDTVDGNQGNDFADLEGGHDEFIWDPGDGSDTIEGRLGFDVLTFNGSGGDEIFDASANGARLRFFRNLGNIVMDTDDVEQLDLNALGGADDFTLNDLTGTDTRIVNVDLAAAIGGTVGDGAVDDIIVNGTAANDAIEVSGGNGSVRVDGLFASLDINNVEATDTLTVNGLGGTDIVDDAGLDAGTIAFLFND